MIAFDRIPAQKPSPHIVVSALALYPPLFSSLSPKVEYPAEYALTEAASRTRMSFTRRTFQRYRTRVASWLSCPAAGQPQETALGRLYAFGRVAIWAGTERSAGYTMKEEYYPGSYYLEDFLGCEWPTYVAGHERYACKCFKRSCGGCVKKKMESWL